MVLTLHTGLLFLSQWHNICKATNCTERRMQHSIFCHDNCKYLVKMRQVRQGAVRLCQKLVSQQWINCASFYVVVTAIQTVSMTQGTALTEQSCLSFHCHICCFFSRSEIKFPCGTTVVDVWNSTYVVVIVKCVFILKMVCFHSFWDAIYSGFQTIYSNVQTQYIAVFRRNI